MTAIAVRERGTGKFARVLRFAFNIPTGMSKALNTWIAVPKINNDFTRSLFVNRGETAVDSQYYQDLAKAFLKENCIVRTNAQRCADWFILRQFRVTGTNAGIILMSSVDIRNGLGIAHEDVSREQQTQLQWFDLLYSSWFSAKVSTESMKRGSANEEAVLKAVSTMPFVEHVFEGGMLQRKETSYVACSPDGIVVMDMSHFPGWESGIGVYEASSGRSIGIACLEIKTRISPASLGSVLDLSRADTVRCELGDEAFRKYVLEEHRAQILQQLLVVHTSYGVYVAAAESGVLYVVVFKCRISIMQRGEAVLKAVAEPLVEWAHEEEGTLPSFVDEEKKPVLRSRHRFWEIINGRVKKEGAFVPIKLFKHGAQSLYSKKKGGVDGATQQQAILRCATSHFKWEQKIVSQTLKLVAINAFIGWRIFERQDLLESQQSFKSLDNYRALLNKVQATADFMLEASQELITHAVRLQLPREVGGRTETETEIDPEQTQQLIAKAHKRKRKRLAFFNTKEGTALRLCVRGHAPVQGQILYCALCGQNHQGWRGHRTSYSCSLCGASLCVRVYKGLRKSCWSIWHSAQELKLRHLTPPVRRETNAPYMEIDDGLTPNSAEDGDEIERAGSMSIAEETAEQIEVLESSANPPRPSKRAEKRPRRR